MLDKLKVDYLKSRKCNDIERKKTLSTLIGEVENLSKNSSKSLDDIVFNCIKKTIKNLRIINDDISLQEIKYLEDMLPKSATIEDVRAFVSTQDTSIGKRLIGVIRKHFNGNVEMSVINEVMNSL